MVDATNEYNHGTSDLTSAAPLPAPKKTGAVDTRESDEGLEAFIHRASDELEHSLPTLSPLERTQLAESLHRLASVATRDVPRTENQPVQTPPPRQQVVQTNVVKLSFGSNSVVLWGLVVIVIWVFIFAAGVSVPAAPYIKMLDEMSHGEASPLTLSGCLMLVITCSTFTNPGILACLASLLGGISRRAQEIVAPGTSTAASPLVALSAACAAAVIRGFFLYLVFLSGLLLLTTEAITKASQDQYVQLAGTVSVLAFVIGYDPEFFSKLMNRLDGWAKRKADESDSNVKK